MNFKKIKKEYLILFSIFAALFFFVVIFYFSKKPALFSLENSSDSSVIVENNQKDIRIQSNYLNKDDYLEKLIPSEVNFENSEIIVKFVDEPQKQKASVLMPNEEILPVISFDYLIEADKITLIFHIHLDNYNQSQLSHDNLEDMLSKYFYKSLIELRDIKGGITVGKTLSEVQEIKKIQGDEAVNAILYFKNLYNKKPLEILI